MYHHLIQGAVTGFNVESIALLGERVTNIAATTQEISAQSDSMLSLSNTIKDAVNDI